MKLPVSIRALMQRIKRRLPKGQDIIKRKDRFYVVDLKNSSVKEISLESFARESDALMDWEIVK